MKLTLNQCLLSYIDNRGITPTKLHGEFSETITEHRVLSANNVKSCGLVRLSEVRFVEDDLYKKWMVDEIKKGDILLTSEAPAGEVYFWDSDEKIVVGQRLYALRVNTSLVNPLWLSYYLQSPKGQADIQHNTTGSTVFGISQKTFDNIVIDIPDISTQNKIANILYAIDNQIQRNQAMCHKLQLLAQTTYSRWFNQFEFPNENGLPYKSSGGKMVWNDELKREIPEGWNTNPIGEFLNLYQPRTIGEDEINQHPGEHFVYGANGIIGQYYQYNHEYSEIAITCRGNTCGNMLMTLPQSYITGNAMVVGMTEVFSYKEYVYYNLLFTNRNRYITGSAQPQITASNLNTLQMILPDDDIVFYFEKIANQIRTTINSMVVSTNKLNNLKTILLPLLINGQLSI